ncbi:MAG: hypothetical protein HYX92_06810 [Chloroflexi bacterium]|nr:hypothetical protein [Chloroflexota bacterium]
MAGLDPVYASVFNTTLGNIEAQGLAVAGPLGDALHQLAPGFFAEPDKVASGAWVTTLVSDGASVLASTIAGMGAEVIFTVLGLALLWLSLRLTGHLALTAVIVSVMLQVRGVVGLLSFRFSPEDLEIMGLAHVFTKLLPMDADAYRQVAEEPLLDSAAFLVPTSVVVGIYGTLLAVLLLRRRPWSWLSRGDVSLALRGHLRPAARSSHPPLLLSALVIGMLLFQSLFPDTGNYNYIVQAEEAAIAAPAPVLLATASDAAAAAPAAYVSPGTQQQEPAPVSSGRMTQMAAKAGPSKVFIHGAANIYSYTVNGRPERIQGVGYNIKHSELDQSIRGSRYDWDFGQMRGVGINTVLGWEHSEFDELTLKKAHEYGLGVVMPYYLPAHGDYLDPAYQERTMSEIKAWVEKYRNEPALRMWGLGNEVIHGMGANYEKRRAKAFARFLLKAADMVHEIDPYHPVIYRDAEDVYLGPVKEVLQEDGKHRPWLVYGVNFFTPRMEEVLRDWPKKGVDLPLVVSEFAPSGLSPADRPRGYLRMWKWIAKQKDSVLGGFVYVWSTQGPEAIDRVMGLVDGDNWPIDGTLFALRKAFHPGAASLEE